MRASVMELDEFLKQMAGGAPSNPEVRPEYNCNLDPEVRIERLRETLQSVCDAREKPRFAVGDLITPNSCYSIVGPGDPHIVIDTLPPRDVAPIWNFEPGSSGNGKRYDIRVAVMVDNDTIACFWVESWQYEPYKE